MTPKYYLVTEDEMNWIKNDCARPNIPYCEGCEYTSDGDNPCTWKGANILMDEIIETRLYNPQEQREKVLKWVLECISQYEMLPNGMDFVIEDLLEELRQEGKDGEP